MTDPQTIYIEPDEEITSVIDKIKSSVEPEVVIVMPRGSFVAQSLLNLKLLLRAAEQNQKILGIVTHDSVGRQLANRVGIRVWDSADSRVTPSGSQSEFHRTQISQGDDNQAKVPVKHFQNQSSPPSPHTPPHPELTHEMVPHGHRFLVMSSRFKKIFKAKIWLKLLIPIVGIGVLTLLVLPKARVMIRVAGEPIEREHSITIDPGTAAISSDGLLMPGQLVEVTGDTTQQFPATGKKDVGDKATGKVTFSNRTGEDTIFTIGTKLKTSAGLIYLINASVTVKAATPKIDPSGQLSAVPGQATVDATAQEAGEKYNSSSGVALTILDLVSTKVDKITAESSGFSGGSTKEVKVVSNDDIENGKRVAKTALEQTLKDLAVKKSEGKSILDGAFVAEVTNEQIDQAVGNEVNELTVKLQGQAKAIAFSEKIFQDTLVALVRKNLADNQDITVSSQDQITATVQSIDFEHKKLVVRGKLVSRVIPKLDQNQLKKLIVGKSAGKAEAIIKGFPQVTDSTIMITPTWYHRLPYLSSRISLEYQHD